MKVELRQVGKNAYEVWYKKFILWHSVKDPDFQSMAWEGSYKQAAEIARRLLERKQK